MTQQWLRLSNDFAGLCDLYSGIDFADAEEVSRRGAMLAEEAWDKSLCEHCASA